jgi:NitT/TauT family transport system substrate-binding protein
MKTRILITVSVLLSCLNIAGAHAADKVRVAVAAVYTPFAPIFAAQELGFYKEQGLEVEATVYRGGGPAQEAMAAGAADVLTNSPMGAALAITVSAVVTPPSTEIDDRRVLRSL